MNDFGTQICWTRREGGDGHPDKQTTFCDDENGGRVLYFVFLNAPKHFLKVNLDARFIYWLAKPVLLVITRSQPFCRELVSKCPFLFL